MFEIIFHVTKEETMKLFSLGASDSDTSVSVRICCPEIKGVKSNKINDWIKLLRKKRDKAWSKKRRLMYHNCRKLLKLAENYGVKKVSIYNKPCRKRNQIQFDFELGTECAKKTFIEELYELDKNLSI